jgi:hypothetical protein
MLSKAKEPDEVIKRCRSQAWWHTSVTPALRKQRQEDCEIEANQNYKFEAILNYIERLCLK